MLNPRHVEVQILGDGKGNVVHLYDRDCSVQRRHQKVLETAPAINLPEKTRQAMFDDAVRLTSRAKYRNAGTVEFLVDERGRHYFIEVNPRIQVEHTVTEEVTGINLVQSQLRIAGGATLEEIGIGTQDDVKCVGHAMQCRITTEEVTAFILICSKSYLHRGMLRSPQQLFVSCTQSSRKTKRRRLSTFFFP